MKLLRLLLIITGIFAILLAATLVMVSRPSVQTWAARRVIAGNPSLGVTHLGRVSVGLNRIEISDVSVARPDLSVYLPSVVIELPLLAAAKKNIQLHRLVARGWTLDLTPAHPPAATSSTPTAPADAAKPFTFEGVFKLLELPVDLAVESADIGGLVIFPVKPGQPAGRATVSISGGQLAVGHEGRFTVTTEATLPDGTAPVTRLTFTSTVTLRMDTPHTFSGVQVTNEASATGPGVPRGAQLRSEIAASREGDRETYEVLIKSVADAGEKKLVELRVSNPAGGKPFSGTWKFDVSDFDLTPFTLGHALPKFTLDAAGTFEADQRFQEVKLIGKTDLTAERLDSLFTGLSALGRVQILTDFDLLHRSAGLRVNRLAVDVIGKAPIASIKVLQALEVVPETGEIKVASPDTDLVQISLKGLPLAWARPFAPADMSITGDDVRGEFVARADQGGFAVRCVSPLLLENLTVTQAGKPLVSALDLSITATGSQTPAGWQADVSEIAARSHGASLLKLSARAGQSAGKDQPIKATGHLHAELPAILAQPAAVEFQVLTQGVADLEFTASVTTALQQISSKLSLTGLRAKNGQNMPTVSGDLRADLHADGHIEANVPLVFDLAGRKSDVELNASVKTANSVVALDAQVLSRELYLDDLKLFAALQPPAPPAASTKSSAPAPVPKAPAPDTNPVWAGVTGQLKLALKKVVYAATQPPVEVSTSVKITPNTLTLESLNAVFPDGAAAKVDGVIKFEPTTAAEPYDVSANVTATGFDPQPFLAAANPGKPPTVEGKFDLAGKLFGRTPSLDKLAEHASVDAQGVCRGGKFYGFETSALAANVGKLQENTSKAGSLLSIAGSLLGKSELARLGEKARAGSDTIKRLGNFNFDQLNIDLAHRPGESVTQIKNFSLISPDLRLLGTGTIDNTSGWSSILQSAMHLDLQMAVRGAQADDLRILEMLKREPDALGYTAVAENFSVKGTPGQMDGSSLFQLIASQIKR